MLASNKTPALAVKLAGWSAVLILSCWSSGCGAGGHAQAAKPTGGSKSYENVDSKPAASLGNQMNTNANRRLIVSTTGQTGEWVRVGTVDFDQSNHATLSTERDGPEADKLTKDWQEISRMNELVWKQSRSEVINGEPETRIIGVKVKPGDPNYIYGILNTLERKYGYKVNLDR